MSKKFLSPVGLPHGSAFPATAHIGDMFFKDDELRLYLYDGLAWKLIQAESGGGNGADMAVTWWLGA
jgi:hypothetical protein